MYTTNYYNTFIQVPPSFVLETSIFPKHHTIAQLQFDLLYPNPYELTSDDLLFLVYAKQNDMFEEDLEHERSKFFSSHIDCLLHSPLVHQFGWGIHHNEQGLVSIVGKETLEYKRFSSDVDIQKIQPVQLFEHTS